MVTIDKWFREAGQPLHLADGRPDPFRNALQALVDLFLLAACDRLCYPAWSFFSVAARWCSAAPAGRIHALTKIRGLRALLPQLF